MAKGNRIQVVGTEKSISQNPPVASPSSNPKSGQFQMMGTEVSMGRGSVQSPSANPKSGQFQIVGTESSLSRKSVKGWGDAASLTMSDRMNKASQNAAQGGGGRKRR